jgi:cobalt-zinc-cadmium efflux system protein
MSGSHPHAGTERRLAVAVGLNLVIVVGQVLAGLAAGSVGLLADAGHNLTDTAAVALSLIAVRLVRRPATPSRSFGYHRAGILAAQANAAGILVVTALIAVEAARRLGDPPEVDGGVVLVAALLAAAGNALAAAVVARGAHDLNTRSAVLHLASDALVSLAVAAVGAVVLVTGGWHWLDPAVSLAVSLLIGFYGLRLLRATTEVLLEATPGGLDLTALERAVLAVDGVEGVHDVHVWSLSDTVLAASLHVVVDGHPSLEQARVRGTAVKAALASGFGVGHATVELECERCDDLDVCVPLVP